MSEAAVVSESKPLSQVERVIDAYIAPTKTFSDIRRNASWWLPFIITILVGLAFTAAVDKNVGFEAIAQQQIQKNHFAADQINSLPADQRAEQYHKAAVRTKYVSYGFSVVVLIIAAFVSLLWWGTINFALGGTTKYSQILAVFMYAGLPKILIYLLAAILLFAGVGIDNFDMQNPVGTNLGYFIAPTSVALRAALGFFDIFGLWSLALAVFGTAIVAGKKVSQTALVVVGWWLLGLLIVTGLAALTA